VKHLDRADVLATLGLGLLGAGLWMWWPAGALMVVGGLLLGLAVLGAWLKGRR
jgi:hypothetical protein